MRNKIVGFLVCCLGLWAGCGGEQQAGKPAAGHGPLQKLGAISVRVPDGWVTEVPSSSMRKAQYRLPGEAGDAELAVTYFGAGGAGSVDANIARWEGQFGGAKGEVSKRTVSGMSVTVLDVKGAFSASMRPMGGGGTPKPDQRMLGAIVESPKGAYYFKLTGPETTVGQWQASFDQFVGSLAPVE